VRDPITGKVRLLTFRVKPRSLAHLMQILAQIDAQYPRRERYDA
jgi:hypothetical protein